jgi:hypothetical protein
MLLSKKHGINPCFLLFTGVVSNSFPDSELIDHLLQNHVLATFPDAMEY